MKTLRLKEGDLLELFDAEVLHSAALVPRRIPFSPPSDSARKCDKTYSSAARALCSLQG